MQHRVGKLLERHSKTYQRIFPYHGVSVNGINANRNNAACKAVQEEKKGSEEKAK